MDNVNGVDDRVDNVWLNMAQYLKSVDLSYYYTYPGSLTTPGCNEAVTWVVFQDFFTITEEHVSVYSNKFSRV